MLRNLLSTTVALGFITGCGSSDPGPTAPLTSDTLCAASTVRCIGNATAKCASDGLSLTLNDCGAVNICQGAGVCKERKCSPSTARCKDKLTLKECNPDGTAEAEVACGDGETCSAGACRKTVCTAGEKVCGWQALATCKADGGGWEETKCGQGEICTAGACTPQACVPVSVSCKDKATARVCKTDATAWTDRPCPAGQECYETYGVCLPTLTQPITDADATGPSDVASEDAAEDVVVAVDKGPLPELEPVDLATCTVGGQKFVFTSNKSANYVDKDKDLRVTMDKGQIKIEISLSPIEEFDVGQWTSAEAGDVNVVILYHDGSELPPGAQFKYQSTEYDVELLKFQAAGGRVSGTFSGAFTGDGGDSAVPFENCSFDVKRHD